MSVFQRRKYDPDFKRNALFYLAPTIEYFLIKSGDQEQP
jgi:hypothetical protein